MKRLEGKSAIITGAARGIGLGFAEAYVREGARVAIADIDIDRARVAAEGLGPAAIAVEMDVTDQASIDQRARLKGFPEGARVAARPDPDFALDEAAHAPGAQRQPTTEPRFAIGQEVIAQRPQPLVADGHTGEGHTRLPAYIRGAAGEIAAYQGYWVYPDTAAHGRGEHPQHLYSVRFAAQALYGDDADPGVAVYIDLFEPYLSLAEQPHPVPQTEGDDRG